MRKLTCVILSVITIASLVLSVYLYTIYKEALAGKQCFSDENIRLSEEIRDLKSAIAELEKRNENQAQGISSLTYKTSNSSYLNSVPEDDNNVCIIPSCGNAAQSNSFYCNQHECFNIGCHEKRSNDLCSYCINHKCIVPDCNQGQAYNSVYCYIHKSKWKEAEQCKANLHLYLKQRVYFSLLHSIWHS